VIQGHDTAGRLGEITTPALVLAGEEDILIPVTLSRRIHEGIIIAFGGIYIFVGSYIAQNVFCNPQIWGLTQIITIAYGVLVVAPVVLGCSCSASRSSPSAGSKPPPRWPRRPRTPAQRADRGHRCRHHQRHHLRRRLLGGPKARTRRRGRLPPSAATGSGGRPPRPVVP